METFGQQLTAARKKKQLTQGQLAEAMSVSRSTISHWENGHALPDIEAVKRLTTVLEHDFLALEKQEESSPADETPVLESTPTVKWAGKRAYIIAAAVLLAAVAALIAVLSGMRNTGPQETLEPYTLAWYQQTVENDAKHAYVTIVPEENPTYAQKSDMFPTNEGWFYHFWIHEVNGVDFTVENISITIFKGERGEICAVGKDVIIRSFDGDQIRRGINYHWQGGFPLQDVTGVGLALSGRDSKGREMTFRGYVELSKEIR